MKLDANFATDLFPSDKDTDTHLVVSLTAPAKAVARPTLCIIPVLDNSGSMGHGKLDAAKASIIQLIQHLKDGDYCGLITFESSVEVVIEPQQITSAVKDQMKAAVGRVQAKGGTNFSGGLLKAIEKVKNLDLPLSVIKRVIMFTDGQANEGVATTPETIIPLLSNCGPISVSAFGFGRDVSHEFLANFSSKGNGSYALIENADTSLAAFGKELGGLLSTYATDISIRVNSLQGHEITEVITDVESKKVDDLEGGTEITIKDIYAEETRHFVIAVKLQKQNQAFPRPVNVFDVSCEFNTLTADGKQQRESLSAKGRTTFAKNPQDPKTNADLEKIVGLAKLVKAQKLADEKAKKGDFVAAQGVLRSVVMDMAPELQEAGQGMLRNYVSVTSYASSDASRNAFSRGVTRGASVANYDASSRALLSSAKVALDTSAQAYMMDSFTADPVAPEAPVVDLSHVSLFMPNPTTGQMEPVAIDPLVQEAMDSWIKDGTVSKDYLDSSLGVEEPAKMVMPIRKAGKKRSKKAK